MMDGFASAECRVGMGEDKNESEESLLESQKKASFPLINPLFFYCFIPLVLGLNPIENLHLTLILKLFYYSNDA